MPWGARLTKRIVDAMAPRDVRYIVWDADLKGFGIRIETSGTKTYLVRYRPRDGGVKGSEAVRHNWSARYDLSDRRAI